VILTAKIVAPEERKRPTRLVAHRAATASFSPAELIELVRRFCGERAV
jgi:hypothetical protein